MKKTMTSHDMLKNDDISRFSDIFKNSVSPFVAGLRKGIFLFFHFRNRMTEHDIAIKFYA